MAGLFGDLKGRRGLLGNAMQYLAYGPNWRDEVERNQNDIAIQRLKIQGLLSDAINAQQSRAEDQQTGSQFGRLLRGEDVFANDAAGAYNAQNAGDPLQMVQTTATRSLQNPGAQRDIMALASTAPGARVAENSPVLKSLLTAQKLSPGDTYGSVLGGTLMENPKGAKGAGFGNVNPGDFTPLSLAKYEQTGNFADLVPIPRAGQPAPSGYRWMQDGSLGPIPGGPADQSSPSNVRERAKSAMALRKDFESSDSVKAFKAALPMLVSARRAPDTGAGDLDVIYAVGKALDPGSVVREGELQLVIKSGSIMEQLLGSTRLNFGQGGRLTPERRQQLLDMLNERVGAYRQAYEGEFSRYGEYAKQAGFEPSQVVGQHFANTLQAPQAAGGSAPPQAIAALKANPALAPQFKAKYGYLP